ncbi:MAG: hypothetical protein E3J37_01490 [Anaerolineales bacterium]|nr:MAG: hypothetical protein E3J37_01490 [Anaerolineales bacterium]
MFPGLCQLFALLLLNAILTGCSPSADVFPIPTQTYTLPAQHKLVILLDQASLELIGHNGPDLSFAGSGSEPNVKITLVTLEGEPSTQLQLGRTTATGPVDVVLQLRIPNGTQIELFLKKGAVYGHDIEGQLDIQTISASIRIENFSGNLRAESRRGMVQVSDSQGEIHTLAEADDIILSNLSGNITGANIMGNINLSGMITDGDSAHLETDHGAVNINLDPGSEAHIRITSAGGRIVCTLPGMSGMFASCEGMLGSGTGILNIRTVSGAIRIDQTP